MWILFVCSALRPPLIFGRSPPPPEMLGTVRPADGPSNVRRALQVIVCVFPLPIGRRKWKRTGGDQRDTRLDRQLRRLIDRRGHLLPLPILLLIRLRRAAKTGWNLKQRATTRENPIPGRSSNGNRSAGHSHDRRPQSVGGRAQAKPRRRIADRYAPQSFDGGQGPVAGCN